jgi:hypothetical protein
VTPFVIRLDESRPTAFSSGLLAHPRTKELAGSLLAPQRSNPVGDVVPQNPPSDGHEIQVGSHALYVHPHPHFAGNGHERHVAGT